MAIERTTTSMELAFTSRRSLVTVQFEPVDCMVKEFEEREKNLGFCRPPKLRERSSNSVKPMLCTADVIDLVNLLHEHGAASFKVKESDAEKVDMIPEWVRKRSRDDQADENQLPHWAINEYDYPEVRQFYTRIMGWFENCALLRREVRIESVLSSKISITPKSPMINPDRRALALPHRYS